MKIILEDPVRYGGVSSFGFGGTNAHIILKSVESSEKCPETPKVFNRQPLTPLWPKPPFSPNSPLAQPLPLAQPPL